MAAKRTNLFLYLALVCFVGIIAIFIADGYIGVYDTVYATAGEYERKIETDFWLWGDYPWQTSANQGEKVFFRYQVDNRRFSAYSADIEVSVERGGQKVRDLISWQIVIDAFDTGELEWVVDTTGLRPTGLPPEQNYQCSVIIRRGEIERKIIVNVSSIGVKSPPLPLPPR